MIETSPAAYKLLGVNEIQTIDREEFSCWIVTAASDCFSSQTLHGHSECSINFIVGNFSLICYFLLEICIFFQLSTSLRLYDKYEMHNYE